MSSEVRKTEGLDLSKPIDAETAIANLGNDTAMYFGLLEKLEPMSLISDLQGVANAVNDRNFLKMKESAHSLKSAAGYAGAGKVQEVCY